MLNVARLIAFAIILSGCVAAKPVRLHSTYEIGSDKRSFNADSAEELHIERSNKTLLEMFSNVDVPVQLVAAPMPSAPSFGNAVTVKGTVTAVLVFETDGRVASVSVRESSNDQLSDAVLMALKHWRIRPVTKGGVPSRVRFPQTFVFR